MCLLLIPAPPELSLEKHFGFLEERPFGNIGNSAGRCHYLLSGGCLWCLKRTTPPSKPRLWPKTTEGLLAARETQRFSPSPIHKLSSLSVGHEKGPGPYSPSTYMAGCLLSDIGRQATSESCLREATHLHVPSPVAFHLQWIRGKTEFSTNPSSSHHIHFCRWL